MNKTTAIYQLLSGDAELTRLVGDAIFPIVATKNVPAPYIVFSHIGNIPNATHDEPSSNDFDMYQFACFAVSLDLALEIRDRVVTLLDTNQAIGTGDSPTLQDKREDFDGEAGLFRGDADFLI